jgi:hypothetical protein
MSFTVKPERPNIYELYSKAIKVLFELYSYAKKYYMSFEVKLGNPILTLQLN